MQRVHLWVQVYIYYISSHLCGKNVLAVVHIGDCMSLTDCVLYHDNNIY